jgi:hypothetical protein
MSGVRQAGIEVVEERAPQGLMYRLVPVECCLIIKQSSVTLPSADEPDVVDQVCFRRGRSPPLAHPRSNLGAR